LLGSAPGPVAVFGVAPKTRQTNLSNAFPGATPEPARGTPAPPKRLSQNRFAHFFRNIVFCAPANLAKRFNLCFIPTRRRAALNENGGRAVN